MDFINQMEPTFDDKEREAINEYMASGGWVTEFKKTRYFEDMIKAYTGAKYCWVVSNGTVSLSIALLACGIKPGDEVICPDYTMVATPNSAELIGAKAVFVDVERDTLCMDFEKMKAAITPKTKAVMLVSINGRYPNRFEEFRPFLDSKNIFLIEDAAQSLGSFYKGKHLGRFGQIGSFSFSAPKIISTGQGGALITDDPELDDKIKKIRDFGRDKGGSDHYLVKGWNFKFSDLQAVIGIEQMKKLEYRVKRKKEMGMLYDSLLRNIKGVEVIKTNYDDTAPWFFDILCEDREQLMAFLKEKKNIGTRPFYPPLHSEPVYDYVDQHYPITERVAPKGLWLPSSITLTNQQIEYICDSIKEFYSLHK
ncbi:MAG: DegT/DnrJ/EryC1/StrS family aminotransferase [Bacilli bacterium]|nr:DegT/DnrJ/EryC1/StrS family aminotransferase [Bacilli bacterium]